MKSAQKKTLVFIAGLLIFFAILEIALRVLGMVNVSKAQSDGEDGGADYTILTPGDSFARGIAAPEGKDFPAQLEILLNETSTKKFRLVNTSVAGRNSTQILNALESDLEKTDPEMIILLTGGANSWNTWGYDSYLNDRVGGLLNDFLSGVRVIRLVNLLINNIKDKLSVNVENGAGHLEKEKFRKELERFNKAVEANPKDAEAYFKMGCFYMYERNIDKAIEWFKKGIEIDPKAVNNYIGIGGAYREMAKNETAAKWYKKGLEGNDNEDVVKLYAIIANDYMKDGEFDLAWPYLMKGLEMRPLVRNFYDHLRYVAKHSATKGEEAREILRNAPPKSSLTMMDVGDITFNMPPDMNDARLTRNKSLVVEWVRSDLEKIIKLCRERGIALIMMNYPLRGRHWNQFSLAYRQANDILKEVAEMHSVPFINNRRIFDGLGDKKKDYLEPEGSADHCNAKGYGLIAKNLFDVIKKMVLDSGRQSFENENIQLEDETSDAYNKKGTEIANAGKLEEAIAYFSKAIRLSPDLVDGYINRGRAYMELGYFKKALTDFNKAIDLEPLITESFNNRGYLKSQLGDYKGAVEDYNEVIRLNPEHPFAFNNRGYAKMQLKNFAGALKDINASIKYDPENSYAFKNRALVFLKMNKRSKACADMKKAVAMGFTNKYGPEVLEMIEKYCK